MTSTYEDRTLLAVDVAIKAPCRAATTAAITLGGLQTIDGIALAANDRVLVKNQTSGVNNGIYLASTGAWTRTTDFDGNRDAVDGTIVLVRSGTLSTLTLYELSCSTSPANIGTTSLTFNVVSVVVGNAGSFTTLTASGQITSSVATGTAPLVIASTTKVSNLNADLLDGTDWRAPGTIGGTTPGDATFGTMTATSIVGPLATAAQTNVTSLGTLVTGTVAAAGTGAGTATLVGRLNSQFTAVGNVGAGTDDLMTYSLPANSLSTNGKGVRMTSWGTAANNANAKTIIANFGNAGTGVLPLTISIVSSWEAEMTVIRSGANTQMVRYSLRQSAAGTAGVQTVSAQIGSVTDTSAITIKMTAIGVADDDIVQRGMVVEFLN